MALRPQLVELLAAKRYEAALDLLYQARAESPKSDEITQSITKIKEFLVVSYARKLGGLDRVAAAVPVGAARSPEALLVARYVDGKSTFGDISHTCPLGRMETLRILVALYEGAGTLSALGPDLAESSSARPRESAPAPVGTHATLSELPTVSESKRYELPQASLTPEEQVLMEALHLASAAFVQRHYEEVITHCERCLAVDPQHAAATVLLKRARREKERAT